MDFTSAESSNLGQQIEKLEVNILHLSWMKKWNYFGVLDFWVKYTFPSYFLVSKNTNIDIHLTNRYAKGHFLQTFSSSRHYYHPLRYLMFFQCFKLIIKGWYSASKESRLQRSITFSTPLKNFSTLIITNYVKSYTLTGPTLPCRQVRWLPRVPWAEGRQTEAERKFVVCKN